MKSEFSFEIKIVYDDLWAAQPNFLRGFGFSALIYNNPTYCLIQEVKEIF